MKKFVLASVSAIALFGIAACSDSTDRTTTQGSRFRDRSVGSG